MIVVIPFHSKDAEKASAMLELWSKLEVVQNHQLILACPHTTPSHLVEQVFNSARKAFSQVEKYIIPNDIPDGWPKGPNKMFAAVAAEVRRPRAYEGPTGYRGDYRQDNGPFIWWEPDCVPLHAGCLDRLMAQYKLAQKPFLGKVVPTIRQEVIERSEVQRDAEGRPLDNGVPVKLGNKYVDGEHMVLVGMYDRAIHSHINWLQQAAEGEDPIDVVLQNEICQRDGNGYTRLTSTDLIGHGWHTSNYRVIRDGEIVHIQADTDEDNPGSSIFQIHRRGYTGPAMIHGCKDNSLIELVEWLNGAGDKIPSSVMAGDYVQRPSGSGPLTYDFVENKNMQSSPLNDPEHDTDDLTDEELRIFAKLKARIEGKQRKRESAKTKGKTKKPQKTQKPEVNEDEVWAYYTETKNWGGTLKKFSISPVMLAAIRKSKDSLVSA